MTRKGQGNIDPQELSATGSSLLMLVLIKTLYFFLNIHTYAYLNICIGLKPDLSHVVVVAFGVCWCYKNPNVVGV